MEAKLSLGSRFLCTIMVGTGHDFQVEASAGGIAAQVHLLLEGDFLVVVVLVVINDFVAGIALWVQHDFYLMVFDRGIEINVDMHAGAVGHGDFFTIQRLFNLNGDFVFRLFVVIVFATGEVESEQQDWEQVKDFEILHG